MTRSHARWLLVAALLLATAVRFYRLDAQSFWNDEGNSARLSERSVELIIEGTASDVHPPLYYLALRGWRELVGESEFGLRSLSALAGVLTTAAAAALARLWWRNRPVLPPMAALLVALNPALVYYGQETRMYALLALWATLATLLLVLWQRRRGRRWAVAYGLTLVAGLYTHYAFPALIVAHQLLFALWWLTGRRRRWPLLAWIGVNGAALLAYLPWLPVFLRQSDVRQAGARPLSFFVDVGRFLLLGETAPPDSAWWLVAGAVFLLLAGLLGAGRRPTAVLGATLAVPLLFMWGAGATQPPFFKFAVIAVPPLALLLARGLARPAAWSPRRVRWAPSLLLGTLLLGAGLWSLHNMYTDPAYQRADYRALAARIEAEGHPNAGIILNAPNQWEVFTYYHDEAQGAPVYPLPRGAANESIIAAELEEIADRHDRLYAIFWGEAERDPQRLVERWLDAHAYKAVDQWANGVRFVMYAVPPAAATEMETAVDAAFGEEIVLRGYTVGMGRVPAGDVIPITLFWETRRPLDTRYKVFLHLLDDQGRLISQRDTEPGGGLALTTTWNPGERVTDNHGVLVPADAAPGTYALRLGLYDVADPAARLQLPDGSDGLIVAEIEVVGD